MIVNEETRQDTETGWRKRWFVKNILTELPIVGGFFYTKNLYLALQHVGKSTAMLIGGGVGMYYGMISKSGGNMSNDMDNSAGSISLNVTEMAVGMAIGAVAYNGAYNFGKMLCSQYKRYTSTSTNNVPESRATELESRATELESRATANQNVSVMPKF